ncbi:MAG: glycosyltransferase family 4 protein [Oceanospirillaceae bacterium]|nr:glycosyltransferase family 4 protein [Oceanospirillaceae bacterium]
MIENSNKNKTRILFLLSSLVLGGSEKKTIQKANELSQLDFEVTVAYLGKPHDLIGTLSGKVHKLNLGRKSKFDIKPIFMLRRYISASCIEFVWAVNGLSILIAYMSTRGLGSVRLIGSTNTTGYITTKGYLLAKYIYSRVMLRLDTVVFGSALQRYEYATIMKCEPENSLVLYNGVDIDYFSLNVINKRIEIRNYYNIKDEDYVVGIVAKIRPEKNIRGLIMSFTQLKKSIDNAKLVIVGDGVLLEEMEALVKEQCLSDSVVFVGSVKDVRPYLSAMDVFVLNSTAVETFSNAALEAMAMCLPVVLTDVSGAREMIVNGVSGLLINPDNESELLASLLKLFDEDYRFILSSSARKRVVSDFSNSKALKNYIKVLEEENSDNLV